MNRDARIFVAGHRGMVGSAIVRRLQALGYTNLITRGREELDLVDQAAVNAFFAENKIDQVYMASAKVGGIHANNTYPAEFIYQNLMVEANIIHAAHVNDVNKLLFLGSSCIYPKHAEQPMKEEALVTGVVGAVARARRHGVGARGPADPDQPDRPRKSPDGGLLP